MILVQNHLRLLNGNKILFLLISIFLFSSCGIFSDSTKRRPRYKKKRPPVKHRPEKKHNSKVDSLQWPSNEKGKDQISIEETYGSVKKAQYTVDLLIPLDANRDFTDLEALEKSSTNKFLHYYIGTMLALEDLRSKGINITLNVIDAPIKRDRTIEIKSRLKRDTPDVIIGPYVKNQIKSIANYSKSNEITMVSPWKSFTKITKDNPNYVQLKPDLNKYYETIIENVDKKYSPEDIYLIGLNDRYHKRRLNKIQKLHLENTDNKTKYNIFIINKDSLANGVTAFDSLFTKDEWKTKVFILPNWSFKDETFIYSALRRINIEKGEQKVIVYGLPQVLLNSTKIGYNLFNRLNIRVASQNYFNDNNWDIKQFKNRFYKKTNTFPEKHNYAYDGYDIMMFVGENLYKYGTKFQYYIEGEEKNYLNNTYILSRNVSDLNIKNEKLDAINYFENVKLHILGFRLNRFDKFK